MSNGVYHAAVHLLLSMHNMWIARTTVIMPVLVIMMMRGAVQALSLHSSLLSAAIKIYQ